ncbi:MAG TPA: precorrin-6A reductase [Eubacteriaceae bacterium]|nr:precorrin-6A reductase [Eubacteriaceae bacterium]
MKIVYAGNSGANEIIDQLIEQGEPFYVSTLTEYGAQSVKRHPLVQTIYGKMGDEGRRAFFIRKGIDEVIDATHPYARNISEKLKGLCKELGIVYRSVEREQTGINVSHKKINTFETYEQIVYYLEKTEGNILLTIGSHSIEAFRSLCEKRRVYARVLPTVEALEKCQKSGLDPGHIIGMQGPFSQQFNEELMEMLSIRYLVTKDSGKLGGVEEKVQAAMAKGCRVLVLQ